MLPNLRKDTLERLKDKGASVTSFDDRQLRDLERKMERGEVTSEEAENTFRERFGKRLGDEDVETIIAPVRKNLN